MWLVALYAFLVGTGILALVSVVLVARGIQREPWLATAESRVTCHLALLA